MENNNQLILTKEAMKTISDESFLKEFNTVYSLLYGMESHASFETDEQDVIFLNMSRDLSEKVESLAGRLGITVSVEQSIFPWFQQFENLQYAISKAIMFFRVDIEQDICTLIQPTEGEVQSFVLDEMVSDILSMLVLLRKFVRNSAGKEITKNDDYCELDHVEFDLYNIINDGDKLVEYATRSVPEYCVDEE